MAPEDHAISRRSLLRGAALLGLGGLVSGCGSALASGIAGTGPPGNTLAYWNLFGGGDGVRMQTMQQAYQKQHPGIALSAVTLAWGNPYYTKVSLATLGGSRPPDVAISHLTRASILAHAGLLEPLSKSELAPYGLTGGNFTPAAWDMAHTNGTLYAIPLDTHPLVMYYNTDICKKAGLLGQDGSLKNLDDPAALTEALTGRQEGHRSLRRRRQHQQRPGDPVAALLLAVLPARRQRARRRRARSRARRRQRQKRCCRFMRISSSSRASCPRAWTTPARSTTFATGKAGFYFEGDWEITTFETAKTPFSMIAFPERLRREVRGPGGLAQLRAAEGPGAHRRHAPGDPRFHPLDARPEQHLGAGRPHPGLAAVPEERGLRQAEAGVATTRRSPTPRATTTGPGTPAPGSDFENIMGFAIGAVAAGQMTPPPRSRT